MKILFVHQNFPGQFKHLAPALRGRGHELRALAVNGKTLQDVAGVPITTAVPQRGSTAGIHPWAIDWETKLIRGEAAFRAAAKMLAEGYRPDLILAHPGWGESLFLKEVWPQTRLAIYCEFYYSAAGADMGFDPEFPSKDIESCRQRVKNVNNHLHFDIADAGISPTHWQASTFPQPFRERITVIHDGIDTEAVAPRADASLSLNGTLKLSRNDELITFVNRNLEPYRGYHVFMRALPEILRRRPNARVLIVGGTEVSYGAAAPSGQNWRDIFLNEVKDRIDLSRVHFLGNIPYPAFVSLLQISTVHVYLTYPFVLSWSLLEAMSAGCAIVASDTAPLREAITHDETGRLVNFFDVAALADETVRLLEDAPERERLGRNARAFARERYDLKTCCLPRQLAWVQGLV